MNCDNISSPYKMSFAEAIYFMDTFGESPDYLKWLDQALSICQYFSFDETKQYTRDQAIRRIGKEDYYSGIDRACGHHSCLRGNGSKQVYFVCNSSNYQTFEDIPNVDFIQSDIYDCNAGTQYADSNKDYWIYNIELKCNGQTIYNDAIAIYSIDDGFIYVLNNNTKYDVLDYKCHKITPPYEFVAKFQKGSMMVILTPNSERGYIDANGFIVR